MGCGCGASKRTVVNPEQAAQIAAGTTEASLTAAMENAGDAASPAELATV